MYNYTTELMEDRDRWRKAAEELWWFIKNHTLAVGHEEVEAHYKARQYYDEARLAK